MKVRLYEDNAGELWLHREGEDYALGGMERRHGHGRAAPRTLGSAVSRGALRMTEQFEATHLIGDEPVMLIDEGVEDGSSGAYTLAEWEDGKTWPCVRRMADGRWLTDTSGDLEDITHRVRLLNEP